MGRQRIPKEPASRREKQALRIVRERIAETTRLALAADEAYRGGDVRGIVFRSEAERAHYVLLKSLCALTDEEADLVEPEFSQMEKCLLRLTSGIK